MSIELTITPPKAIDITVIEGSPISLSVVQPAPIALTVSPSGGGGSESSDGIVRFQGKNTSGGLLRKGTPVYISGEVGSTSIVEVEQAFCDDYQTMAAVGLLEQDLQQNEVGSIISNGLLEDLNTSGWYVHGDVYVSNTSGNIALTKNYGLTITEPPKSAAGQQGPVTQPVLQRIAHCARVNANNGALFVHAGIAAEKTSNMLLTDLADCYIANNGVVTDTYILAKSGGGGGSVWMDYAASNICASPNHTHGVSGIQPVPSTQWNGKVMQWSHTSGVWNQLDPLTIVPEQAIDPWIKPIAGARWVAAALTATGFASFTATGVHNTLRIAPITVGYDININGLEAYVVTGAAQTGIELCIYASDPNTGFPIGAPLYQSGVLATTASSTTVSFSFGASLLLTKGNTYWIGARYQSIAGNSAVYRGLSPTSFRPYSFNLATTGMIYHTNITSTAGGAVYNFTTNPFVATTGAGGVNHIAVALVVV